MVNLFEFGKSTTSNSSLQFEISVNRIIVSLYIPEVLIFRAIVRVMHLFLSVAQMYNNRQSYPMAKSIHPLKNDPFQSFPIGIWLFLI